LLAQFWFGLGRWSLVPSLRSGQAENGRWQKPTSGWFDVDPTSEAELSLGRAIARQLLGAFGRRLAIQISQE
jgi:hypothetical protein